MNDLPIVKKVKKHENADDPRAALHHTNQRIQTLVQELLGVMEKEIKTPGDGKQWERLVGSKESAVSSLQKLVGVMGQLYAQQEEGRPTPDRVAPRHELLTAEDMLLLQEWIRMPAPQPSNGSVEP